MPGDSSGTSRILAAVGITLLVVAIAGFLLGRSEALAGGFLLVGAAITVVSVLVPRLEGSQKFSLTSVEITIARSSVQVTEAELATEKLPTIEDIV